MTRLVLTGLVGSKPLGAMAAFGLLRLCEDIENLRGTKLGWCVRDDWVAFLDLPCETDENQLAQTLAEGHRNMEFPWLNWDRDLRVSPAGFRDKTSEFLAEASVNVRERVDFMAAFGSEVFLDANGNMAPTFLHMTSGPQKFLHILQDIETSLRKTSRRHSSPEDAFFQALFGPWLYEDSEHSIGWDPDMERMHALRSCEPSKDTTNKSVRAAVWLAALSLPLFPTSPGPRKLQTGGFQWKKGQQCFRWPLWKTPITPLTLKSLLSHSELQDGKGHREKLTARGVTTVFESKRHSFGQGYGIFRPAELVF